MYSTYQEAEGVNPLATIDHNVWFALFFHTCTVTPFCLSTDNIHTVQTWFLCILDSMLLNYKKKKTFLSLYYSFM